MDNSKPVDHSSTVSIVFFWDFALPVILTCLLSHISFKILTYCSCKTRNNSFCFLFIAKLWWKLYILKEKIYIEKNSQNGKTFHSCAISICLGKWKVSSPNLHDNHVLNLFLARSRLKSIGTQCTACNETWEWEELSVFFQVF